MEITKENILKEKIYQNSFLEKKSDISEEEYLRIIDEYGFKFPLPKFQNLCTEPVKATETEM